MNVNDAIVITTYDAITKRILTVMEMMRRGCDKLFIDYNFITVLASGHFVPL